jgi:hypothetical protein
MFGLSGCKKNPKAVDNSITFDSLALAETYYLNSDPKQPSCNLQVNFIYPETYKDEKILSKVRMFFIGKVLGGNYIELNPGNALKSYRNKYIENFKQFGQRVLGKDSRADDEMEDETGFSYYLKLSNTVPYNKNNILSLLVENNVYEGGAHGSHGIYCYVFDLSTGSFLTEQQIFTEDYKKTLTSIIVTKITKANGLKDPVELENNGYGSIEDIAPNNNFLLDDQGITYYFNENEIAAYVMGISKVFIPYNEISSFLRKDGIVAKLAK